MLVVLCHGGDLSAQWACTRLRARLRGAVELVLVESLGAAATRWQHELTAGVARTEVELADGRRLRSGEVAAVLNRMLHPPTASLAYAVPGDEEYARNELTAFAASWLRALAPRVINEPTPQGLSGRWRAPLHWRALARDAGLPVVPMRFDSRTPPPLLYQANGEQSTEVLTVAGEPLTEGMPSRIRAAARRFAVDAGTPVMGLRFAGADPARGGWRLLDASPYPDLSSAGEAGVDALGDMLAA